MNCSRRVVMLGSYALSAGYYEQFYRKEERVFGRVDLILTPTSPTPAFCFGERADPLSMYLADVFTVPASLAGLPAISIPGGEVAIDRSSLA